jgi:hypothetical protein
MGAGWRNGEGNGEGLSFYPVNKYLYVV